MQNSGNVWYHQLVGYWWSSGEPPCMSLSVGALPVSSCLLLGCLVRNPTGGASYVLWSIPFCNDLFSLTVFLVPQFLSNYYVGSGLSRLVCGRFNGLFPRNCQHTVGNEVSGKLRDYHLCRLSRSIVEMPHNSSWQFVNSNSFQSTSNP